MAIFKMSCFILCYFFARAAFSACEPYDRSGLKESICFDETNKAMLSERCLKTTCDAKKFLIQHKTRLAKTNPSEKSANAAFACEELQLPAITLKDSKNNEISFCLFNDSSVLDAAIVGQLLSVNSAITK